MEKKTKFKRRMFAVAAIVGMGMTMTLIAFGKESFNAENGGLNYVLPADNGYYFLCGGHLYFWNGDVTKQAVPLCSRPNCSHTTEDCVAMIRDASRKMYEVDDGFYVLSTWPREDSRTGEKMMPIWRVEKDGSGKEIIAEIPEAGSVNYTIFQDKIYYTMEDAQEDGNYQFSIWQMSLDGKDNKQIWQSDLYSGYIDTLQGIGDWLYVSENGCEEIIDWTNEDNIDFEKLPMRTNLYLYQPQAEEWITNPDEYKKEDVLLSIQNIYQDEIYLTYYDSKAEIRKVWEKGFDLEDEAQFVGEFPRKVYKWDDLYGYTWPDRNNENENWFEIYDHNGTFVQKIDLYPYDDVDIVSADEKYAFVYWEQVQDNVSQDVIGVIERDKIATQEATLIQLTKGMNGNSFER